MKKRSGVPSISNASMRICVPSRKLNGPATLVPSPDSTFHSESCNVQERTVADSMLVLPVAV